MDTPQQTPPPIMNTTPVTPAPPAPAPVPFVPPAAAPPPPVVVVTPPPSGSHTGMLVGILIAVIILAAAAYYFLGRTSDEVAVVSPSPSASATPTPSVDPTAGWKTYTSTQEPTLSFKYPADWTLEIPNTSSENAVIRAPIIGGSGSIISWNADVDGLGGGCPPERPNVFINEVELLTHAPGLYFISASSAEENGESFGIVEPRGTVGPQSKPPVVGDTGSCLYYPLFTSKQDPARLMLLGAAFVQPQDRATAKQILESLVY